MNRKLALFLIILCVLEAGADFGKAQRRITHSPSTIQTALRGQDEKVKGSISGRVVNETGEPVAGLVVFVIYGRRGVQPGNGPETGLILTDKEGRFHIPDLLPSEYIVSVGWPCCGESPGKENEAPYYQTAHTYYKDTTDRKGAVPVRVKANIETGGIEITLRRPPLHKVSGTVFNRDGQPLPRARVSITRKQKPDESPHSQGVSTVADAEGKWSFEVPDGVYLIKARQGSNIVPSVRVSGQAPQPQTLPTLEEVPFVPAQPRQVSVSGADVPDVLIDMNRRAQIISGKVVLEDGSPVPSKAAIDVAIGSGYDFKRIEADGSFEFKGPMLGGDYLYVVCQPFGAYYVKSITWDGTDYLREEFEFGNGVDYKGVEVVVSSRGTLVEGSVRTKSRDTAGQLWLIPEDETKWRAPLTWGSASIQSDGTFTLYAAPGSYLILVDANRSFDPYYLNKAEDYIRQHAPRARRLKLKAGERQTVEF